MVIPISEELGVIMISYSDNKFAEFWKSVYDKRGEKGLNKELQRLFLQATGMNIPDAIEIRCFFWEYGVGYWGKGADSESISEKIIQPFENKSIYICGENFSHKYQQWMEGALDTGSRVIQKIFDV
jgi:monoamine oxidase